MDILGFNELSKLSHQTHDWFLSHMITTFPLISISKLYVTALNIYRREKKNDIDILSEKQLVTTFIKY